MTRYNLRMLRGGRVVKKKEGERIKRWKVDYERFINDARNIFSVDKVIKEIAQTFENNAIEQEKVSLICPLAKERIRIPVRYGSCHHLQCFDLKKFLAMKTKRNFLECPICNTKVENELTGLRIDKYFEKLLFEVVDAKEVQILRDGFFTAIVSHSTSKVIKQIDDEEPYVPESTTHIPEMKSETVVEKLDSLSSSHIDSEADESDAETQNLFLPDSPLESDTNQTVYSNIAECFEEMLSEVSSGTETVILGDDTYKAAFSQTAIIIPKVIDDEELYTPDYLATHTCKVKAETGIDEVQELGLDSSNNFDSEANANEPEAHNLHILDTSMASDTNQAALSTIAKSGKNIGEKRYKCGHCSYVSDNSSHLLNHSRTHTGEKPYKCSQCSYASVQLSSLKSHMRAHSGEKPYKCNQCSFACARSDVFKKHMRTHTGEKPFPCSQCSFAAARAYDLRKHMRTHTGEKPYKCSQCSYATTQANTLKIHIRTHTGEKPYKCSQCSYAGASSSDLKMHIRSHTGEKPYKCCQCSYAGASSSDLKRHMRAHSGEKPYKCNQCFFACAWTGNLKTHMLTHTGEKPYKCDQCSFASIQAIHLKSHMRTHI